MTELEIKINSYSDDMDEPRKNIYLYDVFELISKLKSYCEIEIYLIHLAETINQSKIKVFSDFNSMYVDRNKDDANFIVTKSKLGANNG